MVTRGKFGGFVLTDRGRDYLAEHFHNTKNRELAETLGISETAMHRFARTLGLKKDPEFVRQTQSEAKEAAARAIKAMKWRDPERYGRFMESARRNLTRAGDGGTTFRELRKNPEKWRVMREKAHRALEERRERDRRRIRMGLEPLTRLGLGHTDGRKPSIYKARYYLKKRRYVPSNDDMKIVYYNQETLRREKLEAKYSRMFGLKFLQQEGAAVRKVVVVPDWSDGSQTHGDYFTGYM